jgi:hypothetical protein
MPVDLRHIFESLQDDLSDVSWFCERGFLPDSAIGYVLRTCVDRPIKMLPTLALMELRIGNLRGEGNPS